MISFFLKSERFEVSRQLFKFCVVGLLLIVVDSSVYYLLFKMTGAIVFSKASAYALGIIVSFVLNKFWTFSRKGFCRREVAAFAVLYASTLFINTGINKWIIMRFDNYIAAYLTAVILSSTVNFAVQKFIIFKKSGK